MMKRLVRAVRSRRCMQTSLVLWVMVSITTGRLCAESASDSPLHPPQGVDPTLAIDLFVAAGWQAAGVEPSARCDDAEFGRRVFLDLVGRIPTRDESASFLADANSNKRDELIQQLLVTPEYARHMADLFDAMLLGRPTAQAGRRRNRGRFDRTEWREYLQDSFAANRPWNQMARDMTLARVGPDTDVRGAWFLYERRDDHQAIAEAVGPAFFGIRIECAQCHDHPLASEILQSHYWGLVAFFNRGKNQDTDHGPRVTESALGGFQKYTDLAGDSFETQLTFYRGPIINEERPPEGTAESDADYELIGEGEPRVPKFSRRQQFADRVLANHPLVATALVNRLWALLMGRGIVHPYDRMDSTHPPSHPELLAWLSDDFRASGYDVRRLVTAIVSSQAYQLDSRPTSERVRPEYFAAALAKPLDAESLLRSAYVVATGEPTEPDPQLMAEFCRQFPDVLPEEATTNVSSALLMTNHGQFNDLLHGSAAKAVDKVCALADTGEAVDAAFQLVFGRDPDQEEKARSCDFVMSQPSRDEAMRQLVWALVASAEFRFNH